jgi:DNA-directed RNA polymerase subunit beta
MGLNTNTEILELYDPYKYRVYLNNTLERDETFGTDDALEQLYDKLRPGEKATPEGARNYLGSRLFDTRRYDLASVGRYKVNKKLDVLNRLQQIGIGKCRFVNDLIHPETGEVIYPKGTTISQEVYEFLSNHRELLKLTKEYDQMLEGKLVILEIINVEYENNKGETRQIQLIGNDQKEQANHITLSDILASVGYYMDLHDGIGKIDDIDHLGNRRLRLIGELLQNQFRIGLTKMEKNVRDRMSTSSDNRNIIPQNLINIRTLTSSIREFFGSSQLSQFMDQINPLSELTHKRRLSAL